MTMSKELLAGVAVLALAMGSTAHAARAPMKMQAKAGQSFHYSLIGVTPQQKMLLSQAASRMPEQSLPRGLPGNPVISGDAFAKAEYNPFHVAFMSHGAAGARREGLRKKGNR
jgi:hypothetical protein